MLGTPVPVVFFRIPVANPETVTPFQPMICTAPPVNVITEFGAYPIATPEELWPTRSTPPIWSLRLSWPPPLIAIPTLSALTAPTAIADPIGRSPGTREHGANVVPVPQVPIT